MPLTQLAPQHDHLPIAKAAIVDSLVFCTVVPDDDTGAIVGDSITEQARRVFANLATVLAECGCTLSDLAHVTVYLPDMEDRAGMGSVWQEVFAPRFPARATIGVASLADPAMRIEISAVAHRPQ